MPDTTTTIAERVAAGAAFLDGKDPGWDRNIDLASLALESCYGCVLGQLRGNYEDGLIRFGLSDQRALELGFKEEGMLLRDCDYAGLTAEWKRLIEQRRAAS